MPRATNHNTTFAASHCNLTDEGAALFALGGGPAVAAASLTPDAELLACCTLALAIDAHSTACCDVVDDLDLLVDDPRWKAAYKEASRQMPTYHALVERAVGLPARTPEGLRAKAQLVLSYLCTGDNDADIALSLARDVLGRA